MAFGSSTVGLLWQLRADGSQATSELKKVQTLFAGSGRYFDEATLRWRNASGKFVRGFDDDLKKAGNSIKNFGAKLAGVGSAITSVGGVLTGALTAPLAALAGLGTKSALSIDQIRTKITALVGDADKANEKMQQLRALADTSVGVTQKAALETFAQLKGIGGITDETINQIIASMGKLNAAFKIDDLAGFNQNLNQIFSQGFERSDIKEAIGRVPFFEQLLEQAFGTKDGEKLRQLKDSGKLTLDSFLSGISEAIDTDPRIANIQENLSTKLAKGAERLNVALAPVGNVILSLIVPALEAAAPYLEAFFNWFSQLSPLFQTIIVAVGAFAAALGPVLLAVGGIIGFLAPLVSGIGGLITSIVAAGSITAFLAGVLGAVASAVTVVLLPALKVIIPVAIAVGAVIAVLAAGAIALYAAWQTNFGGIRDFTFQAWEAVKSATKAAYDFIYGATSEIIGAVVAWWRENYPAIREIVVSVSDAIRNYIQNFINAVNGFWREHGERIKEYASAAWAAIRTVVGAVMTALGDLIKVGLKIMQGDWKGAWDAFLVLIQNAWKNAVQIAIKLKDGIAAAIKALLPILIEWGGKMQQTAAEWALAIVGRVIFIIKTLPQRLLELIPEIAARMWEVGKAIWDGIKKGWQAGEQEAPIVVPAPQMAGAGAQGMQLGAGATPAAVKPEQSAEEAKKAAKEREKRLREELQSLQNLNRERIEAERILFEQTNRANEAALEAGDATFEEYRARSLAGISDFKLKVLELMEEGFQLAVKGKSGTELDALSAAYQNELAKFTAEVNRQRDEVNKKATDGERKAAEERLKAIEAENARKLALDKAGYDVRFAELKADLDRRAITEVEYERAVALIRLRLLETERTQLQDSLKGLDAKSEKYAEVTARIAELDAQISQQQIENAERVRVAIERATEARDKFLKSPEGEPAESGGEEGGATAGDRAGIFDGWTESWERFIKAIEGSVGIGNIITGIADLAIGAMQNMASAVGQALESWVLYGDSIGKALRKALAAQLAHIAAVAVVNALYATALGFLRLAQWDFAGAANAFISAGVWAAIAGGAAFAGRAVAGNAFRQANDQSASNQAAISSGSGNNRGQAGAFSGQDDGQIIHDRNAPSRVAGQVDVNLKLNDRSGWFTQIFKTEWRHNGDLRNFVLEEIRQS